MNGEPRTLGPGPGRGLAPRFNGVSLRLAVRIAAVSFGATVLFGLLVLVSLWFAIPAAITLAVLFLSIGNLALRVWRAFVYLREWRTRLTIRSDVR